MLLATFVATCVLFVSVVIFRVYRSQRLLPSGPNPIPLIGNIKFPISRLDKFQLWAEEYPEVMTLRVWGQNVIVLNSFRAASEILEKRAASTSIRPQRPMCHELVGFKNTTSQTNDMVQHKSFWAMEELEMRKAALQMLTTPDKAKNALKRAISAIVFHVAYGYNIGTDGDSFVKRIEHFMGIYQRLLRPAEFLVDIIPPLKHIPEGFPGASFKRTAREWKEMKENIYEEPFQRVKRDMRAGNALPSFTQHLLEEFPDQKTTTKYSEEHVRLAAGSIYTGGNDNNAASVQSLLAAIVLFPHVQAKAQAELDRVVGRERLPCIADLDNLPYCVAIVQELFRWHPATPFALPHAMERDEEYLGYVLPKGATVFANVWAMTRDQTAYPSPEEFIPERYLSTQEDGSIKLKSGRSALAFGFGRRVCPGVNLAEAVAFASLISILWSSTVSWPPGTENDPIEFETHGVHWPKEFPISFKERFPDAMELLRGAIDVDK